ncbi:MAG TPA: purine-nucleoside phosphorylase [Clostridiaceae bacterium]|nr:purine-nucleoside phosphorylase [Clostridiaceae bacterium]
MDERYKKALKAAEYIRTRINANPEIGVVLGSGLGIFADRFKETVEIEYKDIPGFPVSTVKGHAGKLICGSTGNKTVLAMKGRFHYYEGYDVSRVVFYVWVFRLLGINNLLITNAAGGINKEFKPGDLMLIRDHISFFAPSPLRGENLNEFGERFPDMTEVYSRKLIELARKVARELHIDIKEGVYAFTQGPMYETPAEIRALEVLGADAVGMSTVPETIAAKHAGMNILGISCITNMAAGILDKPLNHEEVVSAAKESEHKFSSLVAGIIERWE